jgi:hypothetical protein
MLPIVLGFPTEQRHHILHGEVLDGLATLDSRVGEFTLGFLELEDTLFDRVVDAEAVDGYVDSLVEAVDAVDGLFFYKLLGLLVKSFGG